MTQTPFSLINDFLERFFMAITLAFNQFFSVISQLLNAFI